MKQWITALSTIAVVLTAVLPSFAQESPWISVPSAVMEGDEATLSGGNLPPESVVTVTITGPLGTASSEQAQVASDGGLTYRFIVPGPGVWVADVSDASGQVVGSAQLAAGAR